MTENTTATSYDDVAYNDLKKLASERGLNPSGTKEELKARLVAFDNGEAPAGNTSNGEAGEGAAPAAEAAKPAAPATRPLAPAPSSSREIEKKHMTKAMFTKAALDKQPKVMVFIPFEAGEKPEQASKVPFHVGINGYNFDIPRGVAVEVPKQVAEMIAERLQSEGRAGREHRIDADASRAEALS